MAKRQQLYQAALLQPSASGALGDIRLLEGAQSPFLTWVGHDKPRWEARFWKRQSHPTGHRRSSSRVPF